MSGSGRSAAQKLVSVIVPVYNVKDYLRPCVDSIIGQTYQELEILLVDDGSTDGCGDLCDEYQQKDSRIQVIHKPHGEVSSARNAGLEICKGEYVSFVDSDDVLHPQFIECLYKACEAEQCAMAICRFRTDTNWDRPLIEGAHTERKKAAEFVEHYYDRDHNQIIVVWNKLYRREVIGDIRFPEGKIHEDEYTTVKYVYRAQSIVFVDEVLYCYTKRPGSIVHQEFNLKRLDMLGAYLERREFYHENGETQWEIREEYFYLSALLDYYSKLKKYLPEEKEKQKELLELYREAYRNYEKSRWNGKRRLLYGVCRMCPEIYTKIKGK